MRWTMPSRMDKTGNIHSLVFILPFTSLCRSLTYIWGVWERELRRASGMPVLWAGTCITTGAENRSSWAKEVEISCWVSTRIHPGFTCCCWSWYPQTRDCLPWHTGCACCHLKGGQGKRKGSEIDMRWDEIRWDEMTWHEVRWDEVRWDEMR